MHATDLANLPANLDAFLARLSATGRPEVLTVDGAPRLVVQDPAAYRRMAELARQAEDMAAIKEGLAQAERGEMRPAEDFFQELAQKHGFTLGEP